MKVLVLDTVHGGKIIAENYKKHGDDVTAVDVYHVTPRDVLGSMVRKDIRVPKSVPEEDFDLCVMPCHCPEEFIAPARCKKVITFSEAVNNLFDPWDKRFRIEVTGVKGKTSTCFILAHILDTCGRKTYLHTSRGMGPYHDGKQIVTDFQSIAPSTLLNLPRTEYDVLVCEVSLGGSGRADIAAITNLVEDYGIARNTRTAREGKRFILTDNVNVVREDEETIWSVYGKPLRLAGKRVSVSGSPEFGKPLEVTVDYNGAHKVTLSGSYLAIQYLDSMDMALEICSAMDLPADDVLKGLASFPGVPGRGQISVEDGVNYVRDRNPGVSHMSVRYTLSCLKALGALDGAVMVVDPVSKKVCDKMDKSQIAAVADEFGVRLIVTDGCGGAADVPSDAKTVVYMVKEGYQ